ncbi:MULTISPECIES: zinc ABC transporter substrate-binding protein [unclassified Paracoccus (in: a-proteobacteria)]|uniref:zinc ABC transporter substrate-binding protein n=1 Tax=unclassified Paracoccus (in: a-proteobacteria) TaxID=2688777 RepID=UPI0012B3FC23|nr:MULTISPECIES: zinc ABC transporter substrate-binding protein [unclassified Paracoccus (in: a-proteobacteria)]UXU75007.1 zinc ABC transporter substrate-binding protein [Paracoccus sp. SMMA_5]UXU80910.1 zinc ABC transporter substrate-binding protein [Paracoccus sp. SMMA_5_TC]
MLHKTLVPLMALSLGALPALADVPRVVTDLPPVAALVDQVLGDLGSPTLLVASGADAHSYQLRPSQARALQQADLVVWVGPQMTPWLQRAVDGRDHGDLLTLLTVPGTHLRNFDQEIAADAHDGKDEHAHEHEHEHEHEDAGDHGHDHDHSGIDPHAWLDPRNAELWLQAIAQALSARDPANAAAFAANAERAAAEMQALDAELEARLAPLRGKPFVVFHDAYGYFTDRYGVGPTIAVSLGDASTPSAARLQSIRQQAAQGNAHCAFPEANHDRRLIASVTEGSGVRAGEALDPEGSTLSPGPQLYTELLRNLGSTLADCLSRP